MTPAFAGAGGTLGMTTTHMDFSLAPHALTYIAGFPLTDSFWVTIVLGLILIYLFAKGSRKMKEVPRGLQLWLEVIVDGSRKFIASSTHSAKVTNRLHPWLLTILLIFLLGNVASFLPGIAAVTYHGHPLYRASTTDYNLIFMLAFVFLMIAQFAGIASGGLLAYLGRFLNFKSPATFILGLFEIIGEFAKLISVSFRFFGNAFAAEVMLAVLFAIVPYLVPLPFMMILLLAAFVQPVVFTLLIMIYIQMSVAHKKAS